MHFDPTVIVDEAQRAEFIHEKAHARARRPNHFSERLLADLCDYRLRSAIFAEIRQQQKESRS